MKFFLKPQKNKNISWIKIANKLFHDFLEVNIIEWQIFYTSKGAVFAKLLKELNETSLTNLFSQKKNVNWRE